MILAIDTSTEWIGLALYDGVQTLAEHVWRSRNYHTVELMPAIEQMLKQTGSSKAEITGVAVAIGPGSFTGLRIGMAAAKGIGLALGVPVVGVPSLDILAAGHGAMRRPMIALLQIGRGRFAWARYQYKKERWERQGEVMVDEPRAIAATIKAPVFVCGEMSAENRQILGRKWKTARLSSGAQGLRRPAVLAELGWQKLQKNEPDESLDLTPIYVHTLSNVPDL